MMVPFGVIPGPITCETLPGQPHFLMSLVVTFLRLLKLGTWSVNRKKGASREPGLQNIGVFGLCQTPFDHRTTRLASSPTTF